MMSPHLSKLFAALCLLAVAAAAFPARAQDPAKAAAFAAAAEKRLVLDKPNIQGDDANWLFLVRELRQVSLGDFWKKDWATVATNKTDPTPHLVDFHNRLKAKGIDLIFVPVPAKAVIYPEKLDKTFAAGQAPSLKPYVEQLRAAGMTVVDLEEAFLAKRAAGPEKLYCEQDAHFTPLACEIAARLIKKELETKPWFAGVPKVAYTRGEPQKLQITGDQVKGSQWQGTMPPETLDVRYVTGPAATEGESPVLLLGDSHTLVFHEGADMHCREAGVLDQLQAETGFGIDLLGVRGSGMMQALRQLAYKAMKPEYLAPKKAIVWTFSSREFTQSSDKLIWVPLGKGEKKP